MNQNELLAVENKIEQIDLGYEIGIIERKMMVGDTCVLLIEAPMMANMWNLS